jgi:putative tryptophan/tyrosine transport system substrate-binding protein
MKRREFITLIGGAAVAWAVAARAQQPNQTRRIGVLIPFSQTDSETQALLAAFKQRFQELGWTDGRNVTFEHRYTDGNPERTRAAAKELVDLAPNAILAYANPARLGLDAGDQDDTDCVHPSVRSGRERVRLEPDPSRWKYHWLPQF